MSTYAKKKIKGATMIEYVLIVGLITVAAVVLMTTVGTSVQGMFTSINAALGGGGS